MVITREVERRERAYRVLSTTPKPQTARQLIHRKVPWRTTMDLLAEGVIEMAGPNGRAQMTYQLAS